MELNIYLILAQIINFWILFFIFKKFLWDKLIVLIKERRTELEKLWNVETNVKIRMDEVENEATKLLEEARDKAHGIEKSAEEFSKQNTSITLEKAEKEAKYILESAKSELEKDRLDMANAMKSKILDLSLKLNSKIFTKESANKDFLEKELEVLTK